MLRTFTTFIVATLAVVSAFVPAFAEKRVALVVGNSAYENAASLKNPRNDAEDIAAKLRIYGFDVVEGTDLDRDAMERKVREFSSAIADADVALFYYAGHGLQVNGTNYLAPVDATLDTEADLDFEAIRLNLVLRQMQRSKRVNLVFLDACRDNPLAKSLRTTSRSLNIGSGLAPVEKTAGMLIAFATEPGNVALDGDGRNSPFTSAFLKHIDAKDASINDVMIEVRKDVMEATQNTQIPWENSSLTGKFYFNASRSLAAKTGTTETTSAVKHITVADATLEHTFWTSVQDSKDPALFKAYLKRYPRGLYAPIAQAKLRSVRSIAVEARDTSAETASTPKATKVASLETGTATDAVAATASDPFTLAVELQTELKRVGCYASKVDGVWGKGSRGSVHLFNAHAKTSLDAATPARASIDIVAAHEGRICPAIQQAKRTRTVAPAAAPRRQARQARTVRRPSRPAARRPIAPARRPAVTFGFSKGGGRSTVRIGIGGIGGVFRF